MKAFKSLLTTLFVCLSGFQLFGQSNLNGKVIDYLTNKPIDGVSVCVDNRELGITTNEKGEFSISGLKDERHALLFSHISYDNLTVTSNGNTEKILVRLNEREINLDQVVVTGTGTFHKRSDSPVPITVLTAKEIKDVKASTLEDVLHKLIPSFSSMTNGMGTFLNLNGLPDDYFVFLENGNKMEGDEPYSRINVATIKRIEVLSGASSALYGTNAIGGVINIITKEADKPLSLSSDTRYSSKGRFNQSVVSNIMSGKFRSTTAYRRQQAESWQLSPYILSKGELEKTNKIASTGFRSDIINQQINYNASSRWTMSVNGGYANNKTRRPYDVYSYDMLRETYSWGTGTKYGLSNGGTINLDYNADYYTSKFDFFKDYKTYNAKAGDVQTRKRTQSHLIKLSSTFNTGTTNRISVGTEYQNNLLKSKSDNIEKETAYTMALFAQDEVQLFPFLHALIGARYIYHERFKNYVTPNVALMAEVGALRLRTSFSTGFRSPTLSEIYATDIAKTTDRMTIGNLNLKPEKSTYYSFNAEYTTRRFMVSGNAFYNRVVDMIDYNTIAIGDEAMDKYGHKEVRQRDNIAKAEVKGINIQANVYLDYGFRFSTGYSHLDTKDLTSKKPIDKSLKNSVNVNATWEKTWGFYCLNVNLNGRVNSKRFSKTYGYAPNYQLWNLNINNEFTWKYLVFEPSFGIDNLFDYIDNRPYNSNYATLSPGRALYVSLTLKF